MVSIDHGRLASFMVAQQIAVADFPKF